VTVHLYPVPRHSCTLSRGLDLDQGLALLEASLLLEAHDLEAVEVGQSPAALALLLALGPAALLPLCVDLGLLPELLHGTGTGSTGQLLDDERSQQGVGQGDSLSGNGELLV
jgi:hypothetical protein